MNRQVNYIIYAMLLSLSLFAGYYFVKKLTTTSDISYHKPEYIEGNAKVLKPEMTKSAIQGKTFFRRKCASCHFIFGDGPGLVFFEERGPWGDRSKLYEWIRNPKKFMEKDNYTRSLKEVYGSVMTSFPDIKNEEIDAIVDYINYVSRFGSDPTVIAD